MIFKGGAKEKKRAKPIIVSIIQNIDARIPFSR